MFPDLIIGAIAGSVLTIIAQFVLYLILAP